MIGLSASEVERIGNYLNSLLEDEQLNLEASQYFFLFELLRQAAKNGTCWDTAFTQGLKTLGLRDQKPLVMEVR